MNQGNQPLGRELKPVIGRELSLGGETLLADLHSLAAKLLEMELTELDVNKPFLEIGADSIVLINLIRAVDERYGVKIRVRQIFEGLNTLVLLAEHLDRHGACVSEKSNIQNEEIVLAHNVDENALGAPVGKRDRHGSLSAGRESRIEMNPGMVERVIMQQLKMFEQQLNILRTVDTASVAKQVGMDEKTVRERREEEDAIPPRSDGGSLGFWTRPRSNGVGYRVEDRAIENVATSSVDFSLYYFGCYDDDYRADKYDLLIDGARYADAQGLSAVWIPERHFHEFGGISPNPSVVAAALARETTQIELRSGSVVLPLHHPLRVAEEWSVVDNLSGGRVGLGVASGWHPRDFVFAPENFGKHREITFERIETLQQIWRGEAVAFSDGTGKDAQITIFPKPRQAELPIWLTIVNNPETYIKAGELGVGVLTNLMGQSIEDLERNIGLYQQALMDHGHGLDRAKVSVLVHTYIDSDVDKARSKSKEPLFNYFKTTVALFQSLVKSQGLGVDFDTLSNDDREVLFEQAFERYVNSSALVGSPQESLLLVERLKSIGVTEIACLIDFGIEYEGVMQGLERLVELRDLERSVRDQSLGEDSAPQNMAAGCKLLPLTPMQRQMWLLSQMGEGASAAYNEGVVLELVGELDISVLNAAIKTVVNRHESLRSSIDGTAGVSKIHPAVEVVVDYLDLSDIDEQEQRATIDALFREESRYTFDMTVAPMFRAIVIKTDSKRHLFSVMDHHIVSDGWSLGVILKEIGELYTQLRNGLDACLFEPMQFSAYADVIRQSARQPEYLKHEQYWMKQYADTPPVLELPVDYPRPPVKTYNGARHSFRLEKRLVNALRQVGGTEGCTLFMVVFAAYALMIHRLSGQDDVVIGTPVAGRLIEGSERCVGYCLNLLPIRSRITGELKFIEYLSDVREWLLDAYDHQDYPFSSILEKLNIAHDPSRSPLASTVLTYNEQTIQPPQMKGMKASIVAPPIEFAKYDVHLIVLEEGGDLLFSFDYNSDLYERDSIERMAGGLESLLRACVKSPLQSIYRLPVLSKADADLLFGEWRGHITEYPRDRRLHELFEQQTHATPGAVAVQCDNETLTYEALNQRANSIAGDLIAHGVQHGDLVGLCAERSLDMIAGMLGILKTGAAYVPLDPAFPPERLQIIVEDANAKLVLAQTSVADRLPVSECYSVRTFDEVPKLKSGKGPVVEGSSEDLAYVMYTSGSTGTPKGVAVRHRNAIRVVKGADYVDFSCDQRFLQFTPFTFDVSIFEIFGALLNGGRLVVFPPGVPSMAELGDFIVEQGITTVWLTAGLFHQMVEENVEGLKGLRQLVAGGDVLSASHIRKVLDAVPECRLVNGYGPTEGAVFTCAFHFERASQLAQGVPIGKPISNTYVYVMDTHGEVVPVGVPGELYIGGDAATQGYWNRSELTAEKYVKDPFDELPEARLYRSGDIVKFAKDGNLLFLGRRDNQVKVRGFRIELGEIEIVLDEHPLVQKAVVLARSDDGCEKRLVAYIVLRKSKSATVTEMRTYVAAHLPEYMVPSIVVFMESFPLNHNGKIDRNALPSPQAARPDLAVEHVPPKEGFEQVLAKSWREVLGIERIGSNDNFFELGGTSLSMAKVHARLREALSLQVTMVDLFQYPTIAALGAYLQRGDHAVSAQADSVAQRVKRRKSAVPKKRRGKLRDKALDASA